MKDFALMSAVALSGILLSGLVACKTTGDAPADPAPVQAQPVAMAGAQGVAPAEAAPAPKPAASIEHYVSQKGTVSYVASGGRSPFERITCSVSWHENGAKAKTDIKIEPRGDRFKPVEKSTALSEKELQGALRDILLFDPMSLPETLPESTATDMNNYALTFELNERIHTVSGYGLQGSADANTLVDALGKVCGVEAAIDESRAQ